MMLKSNSGSELSFDYDPVADVLTLDGTKYSAELFRLFGSGRSGLEIGARVEIAKREDGALTLNRI